MTTTITPPDHRRSNHHYTVVIMVVPPSTFLSLIWRLLDPSVCSVYKMKVLRDTTNNGDQKVVPSEVVVDKDDETLVLVFDEALGVGDVLEIKFSGVLNEHMKGFYKGTYVDGGVRKNMAVTQFEPADARRCFPCSDEPASKACDALKVDSFIKYAVSFEESPLMSTYLVAVVVGLFDYIEETTSDGITVRAYCHVVKSENGMLALSISVKSIELYTKYFLMPYTLPKLDNVSQLTVGDDDMGMAHDLEDVFGDMKDFAIALWRIYELKTTRLSQELAEQLRLVMEPTLAGKLIMSENNCGNVAIEALVIVCRAMSQLEVGNLAVASFDQMLSSLTFKPENTLNDKPMADLLKYLNNTLDLAAMTVTLPFGQNPFEQLVKITVSGSLHEKLGMGSAVETLCGQAYGAHQYEMLGVYLQRSTILLMATAIPLMFLYIFSKSLLILIGQLTQIAVAASLFIFGLIPQIFAYVANFPIQKFLQAQSIVNPSAYIAATVLLVHVPLTWVALFVWGWGLLGVSLILRFSWWIIVLVQFMYILKSHRVKNTWSRFSIQAFSGLWAFLKLSTSSTVMLCLEVWYFQIIVLIAGLLENPEIALDSLDVCATILVWLMMTSVGFKKEQNILNQQPFYVMMVRLRSFVISSICDIILLALRHVISYAFTDGEVVANVVSELTPLLAMSIIFNGIHLVLSERALLDIEEAEKNANLRIAKTKQETHPTPDISKAQGGQYDD
ncbi:DETOXIFICATION 40-like protein [Tanacetum coccineum]|uniref:Protein DETOXIFICATION n=1 Tax=Tanacetum coccineum TaxID=301880 RepID=A0ABQ5EGI5_9ASTR